jgi:hypothetical protein
VRGGSCKVAGGRCEARALRCKVQAGRHEMVGASWGKAST